MMIGTDCGSFGKKSPPSSGGVLLVSCLLLLAVIAALPLRSAHADTLLTTIPVGKYPDFPAANPVTGKIYVPDSGSGQISVIAGSSNTVVDTITVGGSPHWASVDPDTNMVYVTNLTPRAVQVIDGMTDSIVATVSLSYNPFSVAANHITDKIYVYEWATLSSPYGQIDVIDGATNTVAKTIVVPGSPTNDFSITVNPTTNRIYATAQTTSDQLLVIDGSMDTIVDTISIPTGVASVAVNSVTNRVYASSGGIGSGQVAVIDGSTDSIIATVSGLGLNSVYMGVNTDTDKVYISAGDSGTTSIIDGGTNTVVQNLNTNTFNSAGIAVNPITNLAYISENQDNAVVVLKGVGGTGTSQLALTSQDTNGNTISGYYTVLYQNGNVVSVGFTPAAFTLNNGQTYNVQVDDYGSCHFDHWADTGSSTSASRAISITSATLIAAVYNCGGGTSSSVTVNSVDKNNNAIFGYYAALWQNGNVVATGFTTKTFATNAGQQYSVEADSYGSCTFANWSDGVTSDPRSFTGSSGATSFTAVYSCGTSTASTITVSTVNSMGTQISGYYITLWQNGAQVQSCFSACSFTVNNGQTYQLAAASYGPETFDHWQNDGSTGFETVNVPSTSTTISLTAVYNP